VGFVRAIKGVLKNDALFFLRMNGKMPWLLDSVEVRGYKKSNWRYDGHVKTI
jgi:hypothetical protein